MNTESEERQALLSALERIVANEKFQLDAYFFCGFPSEMPNEKLLHACEHYLDAVKAGQPDSAATAALTAELEAAAEAGAASLQKPTSSFPDIQEALARKALL